MKPIIYLSLVFIWLAFPAKGQEVGNPAPDFELTSISDVQFKLSDQQGKLVVIFIMGYDCPFCISFAPTSESDLHQKYNSRDDFVMVGIDSWNGNKSGVQSFQSKTGVTYPLLMDGSDMAKSYETTYDRLLVVDKEGVLRHNNSNTVAKTDLENVLSVVEQYIDKTVTSFDNLILEESVVVFPNPVREYLNVNYLNRKFEPQDMIHIYDVTGKLVFSKAVSNQAESLKFNVSGLLKGMYFLNFKGAELSDMVRFMKE